jgi:hypothetical protein
MLCIPPQGSSVTFWEKSALSPPVRVNLFSSVHLLYQWNCNDPVTNLDKLTEVRAAFYFSWPFQHLAGRVPSIEENIW